MRRRRAGPGPWAPPAPASLGGLEVIHSAARLHSAAYLGTRFDRRDHVAVVRAGAVRGWGPDAFRAAGEAGRAARFLSRAYGTVVLEVPAEWPRWCDAAHALRLAASGALAPLHASFAPPAPPVLVVHPGLGRAPSLLLRDLLLVFRTDGEPARRVLASRVGAAPAVVIDAVDAAGLSALVAADAEPGFSRPPDAYAAGPPHLGPDVAVVSVA